MTCWFWLVGAVALSLLPPLVTLTQANSALVNKIDNTAEIGLNDYVYTLKKQ